MDVILYLNCKFGFFVRTTYLSSDMYSRTVEEGWYAQTDFCFGKDFMGLSNLESVLMQTH